MKIPTPALIYHEIEVRRKTDYYGQISRGGKQNFEYQGLYALQCAKPNQSYTLP